MSQTPDLSSIQAILREHLPRLAKERNVASLGVFGSRLRREEKPDSDLDLLISFHRNPGLIGFVALEDELSDLLGVRVDLVLADLLKPHIGQRILAEVVPV